MKITATRYDDIIRQRDEYDARIKEIDDRRESRFEQRSQDVHAAKKELEQKLSEKIGPTSLNLVIRVNEDYTWGRGSERRFWEVRITANDSNKFDENVALAWNMDIKLNQNGDIVKDSSSWSGLKAVTPAQIADLEESVRIIKLLNSLDWNEIVNAPTIGYDE